MPVCAELFADWSLGVCVEVLSDDGALCEVVDCDDCELVSFELMLPPVCGGLFCAICVLPELVLDVPAEAGRLLSFGFVALAGFAADGCSLVGEVDVAEVWLLTGGGVPAGCDPPILLAAVVSPLALPVLDELMLCELGELDALCPVVVPVVPPMPDDDAPMPELPAF